MDNLKSALSEITDGDADRIVQAIMDTDTDGYYTGEPEALWALIREACESLMGYAHGSDYYDNGEWRQAAEDESDYVDWDSELSDVKDDFGARFVDGLDGARLTGLKSFPALYKLAQTVANFEGSEDSFEKVLKKSHLFADKAFVMVTRYDG